MTKKDYEMIAGAIHDAYLNYGPTSGRADYDKGVGQRALRTAALYISDGLSADNPRFDRSSFMTACGFPEGDAA